MANFIFFFVLDHNILFLSQKKKKKIKLWLKKQCKIKMPIHNIFVVKCGVKIQVTRKIYNGTKQLRVARWKESFFV